MATDIKCLQRGWLLIALVLIAGETDPGPETCSLSTESIRKIQVRITGALVLDSRTRMGF